MSFDIRVRHEGPRTLAEATGSATLGQLLSLLQVLQVDSHGWPAGDVLLDLSGLDDPLPPPAQSEVQREAMRRLGHVGGVTVRWTAET